MSFYRPQTNVSLQKAVMSVRTYMRDVPGLNQLIDGEETSDRSIAFSILLAVSDYNATPPFLAPVGVSAFPSLPLLMDRAVITILEGVFLLENRNKATYNAGGISYQKGSRTQEIMQYIQYLSRRYERSVAAFKRSMNISQAMDEAHGVFSEYFFISGLYFGGY